MQDNVRAVLVRRFLSAENMAAGQGFEPQLPGPEKLPAPPLKHRFVA